MIYYILNNGKLIKKETINNAKSQMLFSDPKLIVYDYKDLKICINSFKNKCIVIPQNQVFEVDYELSSYLETPDDNNLERFKKYVETGINKYKSVSFLFAITYKCNFKCSYCYQQHNKVLNKTLISDKNLEESLALISQFMDDFPDWSVDLGLFGGEPLLPENTDALNRIFEFCKEKRIQTNITTNGSYLGYYLKKLIINRNFISSINVTIDSINKNEFTRESIKSTDNNKGKNLLDTIKILINYGVYVIVCTNIDSKNIDDIETIYTYLKEEKFLGSANFEWIIGRVDDRLYETDYPNIVNESKVIQKLLELEDQKKINFDDFTPAFIKSTYNLCQLLNLGLNQGELRGKYNYCWNVSNADKVYYIDNSLNTFRCTYTVGRNDYSLFKFNKINLYKDIIDRKNTSYLDYPKCLNCKIGGFCSGGCHLSHHADDCRVCDEELENFNYYITNIFNKKLEGLINEYKN